MYISIYINKYWSTWDKSRSFSLKLLLLLSVIVIEILSGETFANNHTFCILLPAG